MRINVSCWTVGVASLSLAIGQILPGAGFLELFYDDDMSLLLFWEYPNKQVLFGLSPRYSWPTRFSSMVYSIHYVNLKQKLEISKLNLRIHPYISRTTNWLYHSCSRRMVLMLAISWLSSAVRAIFVTVSWLPPAILAVILTINCVPSAELAVIVIVTIKGGQSYFKK